MALRPPRVMQPGHDLPPQDPAPAAGSDNLDTLRAALADRARTCLERLDDVVAELAVLHDVSPELIAERARRVAADERLRHRDEE